MSSTAVALVACEGFSTFHFSVPLILFGETIADEKLFTCLICAEKPGLIWSKEGTAVMAEYGFDELFSANIIIIPYWNNVRRRPPQQLLDALAQAKKRGALIVGLCLGSFVLAYAGLLDHRHAVTHWEYEKDFQALFPKVRLNINELYIDDDGNITSAGTAAALDCCLYIIRRQFGSGVANRIARRMVVSPFRDGGQAQYIQRAVPYSTTDRRINALLDYLRKNIQLNHDIDTLANIVSMSRRTFTRRFHSATGISVKKWLTTERLFRSQELLESTALSLDLISELVGFQSYDTFRALFREKMGKSPGQWRKHSAPERMPANKKALGY